MKRVLQVAFSTLLGSIIPIAVWMVLGLIVDSSISQVFTITYPLQFIFSVILTYFGTGPCIYKEKHGIDTRFAHLIYMILLGGALHVLLAVNVDTYLSFMKCTQVTPTQRLFVQYSILQLYLTGIFYITQEIRYFNNKESAATKYSIVFNALLFVPITLISLTGNLIAAVVTSLLLLALFVLYSVFTVREATQWFISPIKVVKYICTSLSVDIMYFLIFAIGLSNMNNLNPVALVSYNFVTLITDTQWDTINALTTVTRVDISKGCFHKREGIKNGYKLLSILVCSIFVMSCGYSIYGVELSMMLVMLGLELPGFLLSPLYKIQLVELELNHNPLISLSIRFSLCVLRVLLCLIPYTYMLSITALITTSLLTILSTVCLRFCNKKSKIVRKEVIV